MRKSHFFLIAAFLCCMFPACFYSDTEMYEVDPLAGDPPNISISTNLDTLDLPQVNDSLALIYHVQISGGELYYVYAEVAGHMVFDSDSTQGIFWIYPQMADSSGVDTLSMEFYYSSNSNSLADKVGYEALLERLKFALDFNQGEQQ
ncbi:MAG: hypothetical protein P1P86_09030 [Bacteroidales bacterium]|nr:hypothetical protein [Bacteroidales bacterium]